MDEALVDLQAWIVVFTRELYQNRDAQLIKYLNYCYRVLDANGARVSKCLKFGGTCCSFDDGVYKSVDSSCDTLSETRQCIERVAIERTDDDALVVAAAHLLARFAAIPVRTDPDIQCEINKFFAGAMGGGIVGMGASVGIGAAVAAAAGPVGLLAAAVSHMFITPTTAEIVGSECSNLPNLDVGPFAKSSVTESFLRSIKRIAVTFFENSVEPFDGELIDAIKTKAINDKKRGVSDELIVSNVKSAVERRTKLSVYAAFFCEEIEYVAYAAIRREANYENVQSAAIDAVKEINVAATWRASDPTVVAQYAAATITNIKNIARRSRGRTNYQAFVACVKRVCGVIKDNAVLLISGALGAVLSPLNGYMKDKIIDPVVASIKNCVNKTIEGLFPALQ